MRITSPGIENDAPFPDRYTCEGRDVSPPLEFEDVPAEAEELVLVVDDPDAPDGTFTHWLVWNLDPRRRELEEGSSGDLGAREGTNDFERVGWRGPCPPEDDEAHTYRFTLYAVDHPVHLTEDARRRDVDIELQEGVIEEAMFTARFAR